MGQPAAKLGDKVQGTDIHIIMVSTPGGPVPTPLPHLFSGTITSGTSSNVLIEKSPAAVVNSVANNLPPHIPMGPGPFQMPPTNQGTVMMGSATVLVNGKPLTRAGEMVRTCNDPVDAPTGAIVCTSTVLVGGPSSPSPSLAAGAAAVTQQQFSQAKGKGSLTVRCTDSNGDPLRNCSYEIVLPTRQRKKGKTDSNGNIEEVGIDPGDCEVHLYPE